MNILAVYKKNFESVHDSSLEDMQRILKQCQQNYDFTVEYKARELVRRSDFIGRDLVIVLGGDGTLTSISHNVDSKTPVMGVNSHPRSSDPEGSFGFYMGSSIDLFEQDIIAVFEGKAIENVLPRLQAIIESTSGNKFTTDPAMNDLLIANTHQYAPSRYHLRRGSNNKEQHSSGLLFSTWYGQGAWFRHVLHQEDFQNIANRYQIGEERTHYFVVARDISHQERNATPWAWLDWTKEDTTITSDMHRGYVVPDGWDEVHFNRGATVTVNLDAPPLHLYTFRKTMNEVLTESL
jgi:hypothetical protein